MNIIKSAHISAARLMATAIVAILALVALSCQNESQKHLQQLVDEQNTKCPIVVSDNIKVDKLQYSDNIVTYDVNVGTQLPVAQLQTQTDLINRLLRQAIKESSDPQIKSALEATRLAGAKIRFVLHGSDGQTFNVDVDPADF